MLTYDDILSVPAADGLPIMSDIDTPRYAAFTAATILATSWAAASAGGTPLDALLPDVDAVIHVLTIWRDALDVRERVCAPHLRTELAGLRGMLDDDVIASTWGPALRRVFEQVKV